VIYRRFLQLTGNLIIKGFHNLTNIELEEHELTGLTIEDCPNLTTINVRENKLNFLELEKVSLDSSGKPVANKIKELHGGSNELKTISLKNCSSLKTLHLPDNKDLEKIKGIEHLTSIDNILLGGTGKVHLIHASKLTSYYIIKEVVKKILGINTNDSLPNSLKDSNGELDIDKLRKKLESEVIRTNPQLKQSQKEAKENNEGLKKQLANIIAKLGLAENSSEQKILDKIGELMNRPTSDTVVQKNSEIAQKDSKISDLEQQLAAEKEKVADLQRKIDSSITRDVVVQKLETNFTNLGITSSAAKKALTNVSSASAAMDAGNKLFKEE